MEDGILILEAGTLEDEDLIEAYVPIPEPRLRKPEERSIILEVAEDIRERQQFYFEQFTKKFDPETKQQLAQIQQEKRNGGDRLAKQFGEKNPAIKSLNQKRQDFLEEQLDAANPKHRESIRRELVAMEQAIQQLVQEEDERGGNKLHRSAHGDTFLKREFIDTPQEELYQT